MDLAEVAPNNDANAYLQEMSCDGKWGGHPELEALSYALKKTIKVVTSSSASKPKNAIHTIGDFPGSCILLGHCQNHYWSLEPLQSQNYDEKGKI